MVGSKEESWLRLDGSIEVLQGIMEIIREHVRTATAPVLYAVSELQEYLRHFSRDTIAWVLEESSD